MYRLIALAFLTAASPPTAAATEPAPVVAVNRMAPLAELVGTWRGSGWIMLPDGTRETFESEEIVTSRISGAALLVEGRHWRPGHPETLVHDAMAMITWDAAAGAYRFRSILSSGRGGDFPLEVGDRRFTWRMNMPQGAMEYVSEFGGNTWRERGRLTLPNGRIVDFFEMVLTRQ